MNPLRKLFKQFSHFFVGASLAQLLGFITFPILTRILTKEQYGILGLVTITMFVMVAIAKAGLADGVLRFYREYGERRTEFVSTIFARGLVLAVGTTIVYLVLFQFLKDILGLQEKFLFCFMIMAGYLFIKPINIIVMYFLRINDQTIFLNSLNLIERAVSVALGLLFLVYLTHDLYGYFIGVILAEGIIAIILYQWFFRKYTVNFRRRSKELNGKLARFGIPFLFLELSYLLLTYADRYLIIIFFNEAMLGLYSVGYNLAMYIGNIILFSLSYAIVPIYVEIFEKEGKERTEEFLKKVWHYFFMAILPMFFGYWAVSKELVITLASEKYAEAASFSPLILGGTFIYAMSCILNAGLYLQKKSSTMLLIMVCGVIVNISMNYFLLPRYGVFGGAYAAVATSSLVVLLTAKFSSRYVVVRVEKSQIIYYSILSIGMFLAIDFIVFQNVVATLFMKLAVGGIIGGLGILYREKGLVKALKGHFAKKGKEESLATKNLRLAKDR